MTKPATPGTAVAAPREPFDLSKAVVNTAGLRAALKTGWKTISGSMPQHFNDERFFNLVLGQAVKDKGIFRCTGLSILNALQQAASLGLEVNAATGEAFLIPFNDNESGTTVATLMPGYKGLAKLALQSPQVLKVSARLVYKGEKYKVYYGTRDEIEHEPDFDLDRSPASVIAAYAIAGMQGGEKQFEVMTRKQISEIRDKALRKSKGKGPWVTDEEEMIRKTPFRRLCKYLPLTPQLADAIALVDAAEAGELTEKQQSSGVDALNRATARITTAPDCASTCRVENNAVVHGGECPHFADE